MKQSLTIHQYSPKVLQAYIEAFKVYHFNEAAEVHLFPKGVFEIVFQSQHCFQHNTAYSTDWELRPRNFIGGLHSKAYHVKPEDVHNYCIVVEFKPNAAKYFIPERLNAFQNAVVDIADIWGAAANHLAQKIDQEKSDHHKIEHIEHFLLQRLNYQKGSVIDLVLDSVKQTRGFVEVKSLANYAALSPSQFRKRFNEEIGISPSKYCQIVRVNTSMEAIKSNHYGRLTELTYDLGYFDQSHFIKDFKAVMGRSPKYFLNEG